MSYTADDLAVWLVSSGLSTLGRMLVAFGSVVVAVVLSAYFLTRGLSDR